MVAITGELRSLLESGQLAHLVTLNRDGSPQVTIVWIGLDGDEIVSGHLNLGQKVRNVERDPRVSLSIEAPPTPGTFLAEHAILHGRARIEKGGAGFLLQRLGRVYVAPDFDFPVGDNAAGGYVLRTTVERIGGVGPWVAK